MSEQKVSSSSTVGLLKSSQSVEELIKDLFQYLYNNEAKLVVTEVMEDVPTTFFQLYHAICVTAEKFGEVHASRPACCGQVQSDL